MMQKTSWITTYFTEVGIVFGMFLQFWLGKTKNYKIAVTIISSSLFLCLFILPAIFEYFAIATDSKFALALYALSSVISVMILELVIMSLPTMLKEKITLVLGIKDESKN